MQTVVPDWAGYPGRTIDERSADRKPLRVSLVQGATRWHDAAANRDYYGALIALSCRGRPIWSCYPKLSRAASRTRHCTSAETMQGPSLAWLKALAREVGATITGSMRDPRWRALLSSRTGLYATRTAASSIYDKRHLFRYGEGTRALRRRRQAPDRRAGNGWRICPLVCYDLRFPVWIRNRHGKSAADASTTTWSVFVANWPSPRRAAVAHVAARPCDREPQLLVGVNRVGIDGNELALRGDSAAIDFLGQPLVELGAQEQVVTVALDPATLAAHRERFPAWMDADDFDIRV